MRQARLFVVSLAVVGLQGCQTAPVGESIPDVSAGQLVCNPVSVKASDTLRVVEFAGAAREMVIERPNHPSLRVRFPSLTITSTPVPVSHGPRTSINWRVHSGIVAELRGTPQAGGSDEPVFRSPGRYLIKSTTRADYGASITRSCSVQFD